MILNEDQRDALGELINISFSRATASLSELTGKRVNVTTPRVEIHLAPELPALLSQFISEDVVTVQQVFSGPVNGEVFLLFEPSAAATLAGLLTQSQAETMLDASLAEALTEVGNILLNACLGMFGNLLEVRVSFSVPRLNHNTLHTLLSAIPAENVKEEVHYCLIASTSFNVEATAVKGYLIFILSSVTSMGKLIQSLGKLG